MKTGEERILERESEKREKEKRERERERWGMVNGGGVKAG